MSRRFAALALVCLFAVSAPGCGSSHHAAKPPAPKPPAPKPAPFASLESCLEGHGYAVTPESPGAVATAPARFQFTGVWNVVNPTRVTFALTFSRDLAGAKKAAAWTRETNAKLGRSLVAAPVVRIGLINVLWTATPGPPNTTDVYGCIRQKA
jgi:hypothetical protein